MPMSAPPPPQCSTCKSGSVNPRNLVAFIDGTSNKSDDKKTNVFKLYKQVKSESERAGSEPEQKTRYFEGIGTYEVDKSSPLDHAGKAVYSVFEMALAWNVGENVKDAYGWLVRTYQKGDQIYLFGFSRGAYQVRTLASMIHEVGLVKQENHIDPAYWHYLSIDPSNLESRREAMKFRKELCWQDVRIHFVGVWDTVSALGLIKKDVHITASATVTNACHFRHALALDERRIKFLPECFVEVNAHDNVRSPRLAACDVKEVWFAGSHADVGGISRLPQVNILSDGVDDDPGHPVHAGNVSLLWMRREAAAKGLIFKPKESIWDPMDVDFGRMDTMTFWWKFLEIWPIRHQVSFSGTGKHAWRWHLSRARSVIPKQHIHSSILSGEVYAPCATLRGSIDIPIAPRKASDELWATEYLDEGATMRSLTSLLSDERKTLDSLETVLFLLDSILPLPTDTDDIHPTGPNYREPDSRQAQEMPSPGWVIGEQSGFEKFALTVIYDVLCGISASEEEKLANNAKDSILDVLLSSELPSPRAFHVLRFSAKHKRLRRFVNHDGVIKAIVHALERTGCGPSEHPFLLVMESLRYLIGDNELRDNVINQLKGMSESSDGTETSGRTRLCAALEVKTPNRLMASLKTIACLARHQPDLRQGLESKILELAKTQRSPVGSAAIEALVALKVPLTRSIHFSNILGYLGNTLPRLDAEVHSTSSPDNHQLDPIFHVEGFTWNKEEIMRKLVSIIESGGAHDRTAATLTLLKLCNSTIRNICPRDEVVNIFMRQIERKKTSLLAAYALKTCLKLDMPTHSDFPRAAKLIVAMLDKGWFDDAVGRVEGHEIFSELMTSDDLREEVKNSHVVPTLIKKLEGGERDGVRMSLICLDILERKEENIFSVELEDSVKRAIANLTAISKQTQRESVKILAALAQTTVGEKAIKPHVIDIVKMLLPPSAGSSRPRSQIIGPASALYDLSKNETLREHIKASNEFSRLKSTRRTVP